MAWRLRVRHVLVVLSLTHVFGVFVVALENVEIFDATDLGQFTSQRRLRGDSFQTFRPHILCLVNISLPSAKGTDEYHSYLAVVVDVINRSLHKDNPSIPTIVKPSALLVFRDDLESGDSAAARGSLVFLFELDSLKANDGSQDQGITHHDWSQLWARALANPDLELFKTFGGHIDLTFPREVTPSLCEVWKFQGPGCYDTSAGANVTADGYIDARALAVYIICGLSFLAVPACLLYIRCLLNRRHIQKVVPATAKAKEVLKAFPREQCNLESIGETEVCPICLDSLQNADSELLVPSCKHYMHVACAGPWLAEQMTCPLCRDPVDAMACKVLQLSASKPQGTASRKSKIAKSLSVVIPMCSHISCNTRCPQVRPNETGDEIGAVQRDDGYDCPSTVNAWSESDYPDVEIGLPPRRSLASKPCPEVSEDNEVEVHDLP